MQAGWSDARIVVKRFVAVLPSLAGGGAERVTLTLLAGLDRKRFAPHLVLLDRKGPLESALPEGVPVVDLNRCRLSRAMPSLLSVLRGLRPDVVFSTLGYVNLALLAARGFFPGRLVVREANLPSLSLPRSPHPRMMALGYRCLYRRADRVFATSQLMLGELAELGVPASALAILPNPVRVAALRLQAAAPQRLPGGGLRLVAAGRLTEQKGFDRLIPLMAGMPDARLLILGEGPQRDALADLARQYGVAVHMPGFAQDAPAWFAGADALVLPSRWEGMSNAVLEALACGTPVIATPEAGGIAEISAAAPASAVSVVPIGEGFAAAIRALAPRRESALRPSLLPVFYDAETVGRQLVEYLDGIS